MKVYILFEDSSDRYSGDVYKDMALVGVFASMEQAQKVKESLEQERSYEPHNLRFAFYIAVEGVQGYDEIRQSS